jgi:hypothetical protein
VYCAATDAVGNTNGCSFTVTINDVEAPAITCSTNITVECAGPPGTLVAFATPATDNCPGVTVACAPPSGTTFPRGVTTVVCVATDAASNTTPCSFTVTVQDTTPPTIGCPADIIAAEFPHDGGTASVLYAAPVTADICDNSLAVVCHPPSGFLFPLGFTTVTCVATDDSGNTNACSFTVRVIPYRLIVVTSPADSGPGSLRQALLDANDAPGENRIEFSLAGPGPHTISVLSPLPSITSPVIIDGESQPGFSGSPVLELDGSASEGADGLVITAGSSTVRGLVLHGFATGIRLEANGGNIIQGNYIGTDLTGASAAGNSADGLFINSSGNLIGGTTPGAGNVISANSGSGLRLATAGAFNTLVHGNFIGTAADGSTPLGNGRHGITLESGATGNTVGGTVAGMANVIAFQTLNGVSLDPTAGVGNGVLGNRIFSNGGLAIDLGADGVTANDAHDADEGPNRRQNFPVLTDALSDSGVTTIMGTASALGSATLRVEFFLNDTTNREGQVFLGSTTVILPGSGNQNFTASFPVAATAVQFVTATATEFGNTSEFSEPVPVHTPPVLESQPENTNAPAGGTATLCVTASGTPPFTYQWRLNGANIPGATNECYTITDAQLANGGTYTVVVGNQFGAMVTAPATLQLPLEGVNAADNFADRVTLTGTNGMVAGQNKFATVEPGEPRHADKPGGKSVWYTWQAPKTGIANVGTTGSTFDTLLGVYQGTSVSNLTVIGSDEDRGGFYTSGLRFNAIEHEQYHFAIDGFFGAEGEFVFEWGEAKTSHLLPVIWNQPQSQTVALGANATFSVLAFRVCGKGHHDCPEVAHFIDPEEPDDPEDEIPPKISLQWLFNGVPIPDATRLSLTISNVQPADLGDYSVRVSMKNNKKYPRSIESQLASLQINDTGEFVENVQSFDKLQDAFNAEPIRLGTTPPALAGTVFEKLAAAGATVARGYTGTQIFNTTNSSAQGEVFCGVPGGTSRWISLVAETNGDLFVSTEGSTYDTLLAVLGYTATNQTTLQLLGCNDDASSNILTSSLVVKVLAGTTNLIGLDGKGGASGVLHLFYSLLPSTTILALGKTAEGANQLRVLGRPDLHFALQASTDLANWSTLVTTNAPAGLFDYTDLASANAVNRYYRVQLLP